MCKYLITIVLLVFFVQGCIAMPEYKPLPNMGEENYPVDRREYKRLSNNKMKTKVTATNPQGENVEIIDISRGGVAFRNNNKFSPNNKYCLNLKYSDIIIPVETNVIAVDGNKVRSGFVNLDIEKQNKLLYLVSKIELDNNWFKTRFSQEDREDIFKWGS